MTYPKITLYGKLESTSTQSILMLLKELNLEYKIITDLTSEEILKLNPFGDLPILKYKENEDSDERILFECKSILRYISNKHDTEIDFYPNSTTDLWLEINSKYLQPNVSMTSHIDIENTLQKYETQLSKNKYISGDAYTIADITLFQELNTIIRIKGKDFLKSFKKLYHLYKKIKCRI
jgi:glutathione S-transferase